MPSREFILPRDTFPPKCQSTSFTLKRKKREMGKKRTGLSYINYHVLELYCMYEIHTLQVPGCTHRRGMIWSVRGTDPPRDLIWEWCHDGGGHVGVPRWWRSCHIIVDVYVRYDIYDACTHLHICQARARTQPTTHECTIHTPTHKKHKHTHVYTRTHIHKNARHNKTKTKIHTSYLVNKPHETQNTPHK